MVIPLKYQQNRFNHPISPRHQHPASSSHADGGILSLPMPIQHLEMDGILNRISSPIMGNDR